MRECGYPLVLIVISVISRQESPELRLMEITKVTVTLANEDQRRAFASVTLDDCFVIRDLRIIEGLNGLFLAGPD